MVRAFCDLSDLSDLTRAVPGEDESGGGDDDAAADAPRSSGGAEAPDGGGSSNSRRKFCNSWATFCVTAGGQNSMSIPLSSVVTYSTSFWLEIMAMV